MGQRARGVLINPKAVVVETEANGLISAYPSNIGVNDNTVFFTPWTLQGRMVRGKPNDSFVQGTDRSDLLLDGPANDQIFGLDGDDLYISFSGNDLVDFGAGLDVAMFFSPRSNFQLSGSERQLVVKDLQGPEGENTFFNIERLSFADRNIALDMDGSAGWVARVIGAVWGPARLADAGLVGKGLRLMDNGMTGQQLVQLALDHAFGPVRDSTTLVAALYRNAVGVDAAPQVLAAYVNGIQAGTWTQADLGVIAAESEANAMHIGLSGLRATGIEYLM